MNLLKKLNFILTILTVTALTAVLPWGGKLALAEDAAVQTPTSTSASAYQQRQDARQAVRDAIVKYNRQVPAGATAWAPGEVGSVGMMAVNPLYPPGIGFNPAVNYDVGNFSQSPNIRKFVDSLPGLSAAHANNLGQYIPVADADTTSYPGSDYYEIGLSQYTKKMNSDLPNATMLRGYYQKNNGTVLGVGTDHAKEYLGPAIIAHRDKPVRIKFVNELGINGAGDLPLPVDTTIMGAGMGPNGANYTQNRADLHLHGGLTPWISDGTPHQWVTPFGDSTLDKKGVSFQNVPDMVGAGNTPGGVAKAIPSPSAGDGMGTYYYPNVQAARLMFYHDHAYGITRLNVYAGEAAPYLLVDQVEDDLIDGTNISGGNPAAVKILPSIDPTGVYRYGVPLVIQDKAFVNNTYVPTAGNAANFALLPNNPQTGAPYARTLDTATVDPLWATYVPLPPGSAATGNLWFPHEYLPVENPFDPSGNTPTGRWDYAPFMIPPMVPLNLTLPSPTLVPESFLDTAVVNGCAFPYVSLPNDVVRFRVLNACNDRSLNLQLYKADPAGYAIDASGNKAVPGPGTFGTEVKMVPAAPNATFPSWPVDGRDGGVPDPTTAGPPWIQIGNECGFLAKVAVIPQQPLDFEYNRQVIPLVGVSSKSVLLMPAMRADLIVDLTAAAPGDTYILYNDAPAAMPNFWPLNDYYSDCPDQTLNGGPSTTPPGFGPNTRTLMQIRIVAAGSPSGMNFSTTVTNPPDSAYPNPSVGDGPALLALKVALPKAFAASADPILVPQLAYNDAYPTGTHHYTAPVAGPFTGKDNYVQAYQNTLNMTGTAQLIAQIRTAVPGNNYTTAPTVVITGGGNVGAPATATAWLNPMGGITLITGGTGYTTPPTVTIGLPVLPIGTGGVRATAVATISGGQVTSINMVEPGAGYTNIVTPPTVTLTGGGGTGATAMGMLPTLNTVGSITINTPNTALYTSEPLVYLIGGGGTGASADALLAGSLVMTGKNLTEGFDPDFGRMDIRLGSTPNPLTPSVGAGPVIGLARYIDPPTEFLTDGQTILWRLSHLGVDSHSMHFHLFNLQVVNRVDWTGVIKPPYPDEIGWRETIRTNPMEDIIVAIKPVSMSLPFSIPDSNRLLDPTTPLNSTINFLPIAPPIGVPAVFQVANVMTNFGWEYVWHCHLLGHEENDMMRPLVLLVVPPVAPSSLTATSVTSLIPPVVNLSWVDNGINVASFTIQRATNTGFTTGLTTFNPVGTALAYNDSTVSANVRYYYRVRATNGAGNSAWSNTANVLPNYLPLAPTIGAATGGNTSAIVTFTAPVGNGGSPVTSYTVIANPGPRTATGLATTLTVTGLTNGTPYTFTVTATNLGGTGAPSAASNGVTPAPTAPGAPTIGTVTAGNATATVRFTAPASNGGSAITSYTVTASPGPRTATGLATTLTVTGLTNGTAYRFSVRATNAIGTGPASALSASVTPSSVAAPTGFAGTATRTVTGDRVALRWAQTGTVTGFTIQRATNTAFTAGLTTLTAAAAARTLTNTGVARLTTYYYRIRANNGAAFSAWSATITVRTP